MATFAALTCLPATVIGQKMPLEKPIREKISTLETWIDEGSTPKATRLMNDLKQMQLTDADAIEVHILQARMLHENGRRHEAIPILQSILWLAHEKKETDPSLAMEARLQLADCYFGLYRFEIFKAQADTALAFALAQHLPDHYRARAHAQLARYYAYHTLPCNALFSTAANTAEGGNGHLGHCMGKI